MSKHEVKIQADEPIRRRSRWWIALWVFLALLLLMAVIVYYVWVNRHGLVADQIKNQLSGMGYEVELSVTELEETSARVEQVTLSRDGQLILKADALDLDYDWRDAMDGKFKRVEIDGVKAKIKIDANGTIENPFASGVATGGESGFVFPPNGITLRNSQLELISPFGTVRSAVNGIAKGLDDFQADIVIAPADIQYGDVGFNVSGQAAVLYQDGRNKTKYDLSIPDWTYKNMQGEKLTLSGEGAYRLETEAFYVDGPLTAELGDFEGSAVKINQTAFSWEGTLGMTRGGGNILLADGNWTADIDDFSMTQANNQREIAETLSLYESLSVTPVTEDFAEPLTRSIAELFTQAVIQGSGYIRKTPSAMTIKLDRPLSWTANRNKAELRPDPGGQVFAFSRANQEITLSINASLGGSYPMEFSGSTLKLISTNGRNIKGTRSFAGRVTIPQTWRSQTLEGQAVRLAPMSARVNFDGPETRRRLRLSGALDFDGNIPGGYVEGLKTSGIFSGEIGSTTRIYFKPEQDSPITMDRFLSEIPWVASNISFTMDPGGRPVFVLGAQTGVLEAELSDLIMDLENLEETRSLVIEFGVAAVNADIGETQSWNIDGKDILMTSDNMPSSGTVMTTPEATISAFLDESGTTDFTINSPSADIKTEAITTSGLAVQVAGQPEKFRLNYQNGLVNFSATEFPPFQMEGYVDYENDNWFGKADSFLPFGEATPLAVDYRFVDSRGYADVDIPEIYFSPRGLQPQTMIPLLKGKISGVEGAAKVKMRLEFADGEELKSSGSAQLIDMSMGTMPGPMSGINSELKFSSFFPLVSEGRQSVTIDHFDPGFPLQDGVVEFEAIPGGFEILKAEWPLGAGTISLNPTQWRYDREVNRVELRIEQVDLADLFQDLGGENFYVTGIVNGRLPVKIDGLNVEVENGTIGVADGGVIKFTSAQTDTASDVNVYAGYAFDSLKEFHYEELEATFNGPLDGLIVLRMVFQGSNPDVLYGLPFKFNVRIEGELLNIVRNFQMGSLIAEEVKKAIIQ